MTDQDLTLKPATSASPGAVRAVQVRVMSGKAAGKEARFTNSFLVGRIPECDFPIADPYVSRNHLRVVIDGTECRINDPGSKNGSYRNGLPFQETVLTDLAEIELGRGGPMVRFTVEREEPAPSELTETMETPGFTSETQIIRHYLSKEPTEKVGTQTMMFRRAFERVQRKKSRKYQIMIAVALLFLLVAGGIIVSQLNKFKRLQATAENIFYAMKSLELQIAKLEEVVLLHADQAQIAELRKKREKLKAMEREYDGFVRDLGLYQSLSEEERVILRVARIFGECDAKAPPEFVNEVKEYVGRWKATDRLQKALLRAEKRGYAPFIAKVMTENNLPPQYFFLALQESDFHPRAVGAKTRFGYAKGIWQFTSITADRYGLKIGPLYAKGVYDPKDERFNFEKATLAAVKYIKDINNTEAQASGLLVMASYNWGENRVRQIVSRMPEDPRERNFWRLLAVKDVPRETYNYVFYIFSATVICQNPKLFGFDLECPAFGGRN